MSQITEKIDRLNALLKEIQAYKAANPSERLGYYLGYGSLLNAYREGDVGFDECVELLGRVKPLETKPEATAARCWLIHRFGKWQAYKVSQQTEGLELLRDVAPSMFHETTVTFSGPITRTYTEDRQRRECLRCGYTQDRLVREK
jgi:hypothetical protein